MTPVSLKKVDRDEAASLQEMVNVYGAHVKAQINPQLALTFYGDMLEADILSDMFFLFRNKIEGHPNIFTVTLKVSQAVVLIYAMNHCQNTENLFAKQVISKYWNAIDSDLKNRIIIKAKDPAGPVKLLSQPHVIE